MKLSEGTACDRTFSFTNLSNGNRNIETVARSSKTRGNDFKDYIVKENYNTKEKSCTPSKKLIFAKTHKTGSTTVQNIIFRFGEKNHLMFVLPKFKSNFFNLKAHFTIKMAELYTPYKNVK